MKPMKKKASRFDKIVKHIVQKGSPSDQKLLTDRDDDEMAVVDEEEAIDQEGTFGPKKRKAKDYNPNNLL